MKVSLGRTVASDARMCPLHSVCLTYKTSCIFTSQRGSHVVGKTQLVMNDLGMMLIKDFVLDLAQDPIDLL